MDNMYACSHMYVSEIHWALHRSQRCKLIIPHYYLYHSDMSIFPNPSILFPIPHSICHTGRARQTITMTIVLGKITEYHICAPLQGV